MAFTLTLALFSGMHALPSLADPFHQAFSRQPWIFFTLDLGVLSDLRLWKRLSAVERRLGRTREVATYLVKGSPGGEAHSDPPVDPVLWWLMLLSICYRAFLMRDAVYSRKKLLWVRASALISLLLQCSSPGLHRNA